MFRTKVTGLERTTYLLTIFLLVAGLLISKATADACGPESNYAYWKFVGHRAASEALRMIGGQNYRFHTKGFIVLTNAGYAEISGELTTGALDGVSRPLGAKRGDHSLVEVHSAAEKPLWFAVYHQRSGYCAYLEVDPDAVASGCDPDWKKNCPFFSTAVLERINAEHLYEHAEEYAEKFDSRIFGGNEFRIVTIANAVAEGAPTSAVRSFEFHDHYCPGVTSGILMGKYIRSFFPLKSGGSYFVQSVQPWCKEDALLSMLNATPGKKGYAVTYPTAEDIAAWPEWAQDTCTIVYREHPDSGHWEALVLGFVWAETGCPEYDHSVMDKLCSDLWYLERLDQPETFIKVIKKIDLPEDVDPKSYARPGVDPILILDQLN